MGTILEVNCLSCWSMSGLGDRVHLRYLGPSTPWLPSSQAQTPGQAQQTTGSQPWKWRQLKPFPLSPCWLLTWSGIWATPQWFGRMRTYGEKTHGCCLGLPETKTWWSFRKKIFWRARDTWGARMMKSRNWSWGTKVERNIKIQEEEQCDRKIIETRTEHQQNRQTLHEKGFPKGNTREVEWEPGVEVRAPVRGRKGKEPRGLSLSRVQGNCRALTHSLSVLMNSCDCVWFCLVL